MTTPTFDPSVELGKLTDHLAAHDKPLIFLFGAGTSSSPVGSDGDPLIPAIARLTDICKDSVTALSPAFASAWDTIWHHLTDPDRHIEGMLSILRVMREAALPGDLLAGLTRNQLDEAISTIQATISSAVQPDPSRYPLTLPHDQFATWIGSIRRERPIEIFTTNYDVLFERSLEQARIPVFDGFTGSLDPFFEPATLTRQSMAPGGEWTRLWKIHGSVTWKIEERDGHERIVRGQPQVSGEMILPSSRKYDESRKQPYAAMLDRLKRCLTTHEDATLIAAGFGFGDQHINEVILSALDDNPRVHVIALMYGDVESGAPLHRLALTHRNLLVLGRTRAIVGGVEGAWRPPGPGAASQFMATDVFTAGTAATAPELRLGDFNVLCGILSRVGARR